MTRPVAEDLLRILTTRITPEIAYRVRRRAGNRCEGLIDDPRMKRRAERCQARKDLELYVNFWADMADDPLHPGDVSLLCEECYAHSDTAEQLAHFDYLVAKDD